MAADTTSNNSAFIPTPQSTEIINGISNADRGFIDALSRATLPASGMSFEIPKITTAPTVQMDVAAANTPYNLQSAVGGLFYGAQTATREQATHRGPA